MTKKTARYRLLIIFLLLCSALFVTGVGDMCAQSSAPVTAKDTIAPRREAPKARARRNRTDTLQTTTPVKKDSEKILPAKVVQTDSLPPIKLSAADSIDSENRRKAQKIDHPEHVTLSLDTLPKLPAPRKTFIPNPSRATWLAIVFPGAGQIYNRKYWKLPIVYGGFAGCAYALSWNNRMFKDYSQAYQDITDDDDNTKSYETLLPISSSSYSKEYLTTVLKNRKDKFRRYRDLSIFAFIGVYALSIIDAYVDAELSNFDITPDLSMHVSPAMIDDRFRPTKKSIGLQCVLRF